MVVSTRDLSTTVLLSFMLLVLCYEMLVCTKVEEASRFADGVGAGVNHY